MDGGGRGFDGKLKLDYAMGAVGKGGWNRMLGGVMMSWGCSFELRGGGDEDEIGRGVEFLGKRCLSMVRRMMICILCEARTW